MVVLSRYRKGQDRYGLMLWSMRVRQEGGCVEQVGETGESCCGVDRQEGGCVE